MELNFNIFFPKSELGTTSFEVASGDEYRKLKVYLAGIIVSASAEGASEIF